MNSFKNKYLKYKKKYLALKYGGNPRKEFYYYNSNIYNKDDEKLKCTALKNIPDNTKAKYCGTRENRIKCIDNEEDQNYKFEQQEYNEKIIPSKFNYYNCVNDENIKTNFENKTITDSSIVIFGGGPVGLLTAIYAIEVKLSGNIIVIENRENYSRNQDVVLQSNSTYDTVKYLTTILFNGTTLFQDMINKKIICAIEPPLTHIAICKENKDNMLSNYLVKIKELENYFEKVFLSKGGKIIRSKLAQKKIKSTFKKNTESISITIENGPLYNTSNEKIIYNNITINNITHLLCCDGGRPSSRKQLSNLFGKKKILEYVLFDKKEEHKAYLDTIKKKNVIHENNNEHFVSYGVACNILIDEKIVDAIMKNNNYKNQQKYIRFFIPYGNSNYTIEKNGIKYIKAYLGIQIKIDSISSLQNPEDIAKTFHKSLYKTSDKEKITEVFKIINDITSVATTINSILGNTGYNFRDNIMPNCYHISVFPIQLYTANEYLINENKTKIAFIGDATFGVHFFSGTGVNFGMSFGKDIIDYFNNKNINIKEKYDTFKKDIKKVSSNFILD